MSFVIYDVETTGLSKGFDQIVQFAAIRADADLNLLDQVQFRCRLMPHIIPSPEAMHVTGFQIEELIDPSLPSHYEMVRKIRSVLEEWSPALFIGFNSMSFDEEFLRQAFYQCLYAPYLTNTKNNARADVLNLCRVTAALRPDMFKPATDNERRPVFRLQPLAEANGITVPISHRAMADVDTTLALCRNIKAAAPEVWSQFLRFSKKASVEDFITNEDAFLFSETVGNQHRTRVLTRIGRHKTQSTRHYCLDLGTDLAALRAMTNEQLVDVCGDSQRPIVTIRSNAAPTLWALYDATPEQIAPFDESEILEVAETIREDKTFLDRLCGAAQAAEPGFPSSPYVEEQLYERGFPPPADETLMQRFHAASWEDRPALARQFTDERYRYLSHRLIFFERPEFLDSDSRQAVTEELRRRILAPDDAQVRWRSIPAAQREIEDLINRGIDEKSLLQQQLYSVYLAGRLLTL